MAKNGNEIQDRLLKQNERRAKQTGSYTNTTESAINNRFAKRAFRLKDEAAYEKKHGDTFAGGYIGSEMDRIDNSKSKSASETTDKQSTHKLINIIEEEFSNKELTKEDAQQYKGWELSLIDTEPLKLSIKIERISSKSLIVHITEVFMKPYYRFTSETDKTVIQDYKEVTDIKKAKVRLVNPLQDMKRLVFGLICKYKIHETEKTDEPVEISENNPWNNLLNN